MKEPTIKMEIRTKDSVGSFQVPGNESDVFKVIGQMLPGLSVPNKLEIKTDQGDACFEVTKRGTYVEDGKVYPSMYVKEVYNNILVPKSSYKEAYLTCIHPESNNYKYYHLKPGPYGIGATYGRIGAKAGDPFGTKDLQTPYPSYMYWIRYYEKVSKGYKDQSDVYLTKTHKPKPATDAPATAKETKIVKSNPVSEALYVQLMGYARHVVKTSLVDEHVTEGQVNKTKKLVQKLGGYKTVKGFNNCLQEILQVSPRQARYINLMFAKGTQDFAKILQREEDLLAAMDAVATADSNDTKDCFEKFGIEVYEARPEQVKQVMEKLDNSQKKLVKKIYRVIHKKSKKAFDEYLKENHIHHVKQLWHGSRNENWMSIMKNGLLLNPNAQITGKMFGNGIYFANSSDKSFGYTSYSGSRCRTGH